jgi:transposase-like protein
MASGPWVGTIPLASPHVRPRTSFPRPLEPRRIWEPAFVQVVAEPDVLGVSTRTVDLNAPTPPSGSMR